MYIREADIAFGIDFAERCGLDLSFRDLEKALTALSEQLGPEAIYIPAARKKP